MMVHRLGLFEKLLLRLILLLVMKRSSRRISCIVLSENRFSYEVEVKRNKTAKLVAVGT